MTQVMRQEDAEEHAILERIRMGNATRQDVMFLKGLVGKKLPDIGVKPIRLVPVNEKARDYNKQVYSSLRGDEDVYHASCRAVVKLASADSEAESDEEGGAGPGADCQISHVLRLEKDADKVGYARWDSMYSSEMINDSIQIAHSTFISSPPVDHALCLKPKMPVMVTRNTQGYNHDKDTGEMKQVDMFNGMRGLYIGRDTLSGNPIVDLEGGERVIVNRIEWKVKSKDLNEDDELMSVSVVYEQIPLMHAAAISIHKSLGLTLTQVELDIGSRVFAFGQAYVGISRTKSLKNGLSIVEVDPSTIIADPACVDFYRRHETSQVSGEEARVRLLEFMKRRMEVGLGKYKHGIRREDDTRTFGTETDSWEEMAMKGVSDCIVYCAAAQLRREGPQRPEGALDDNQAVLDMVGSGQNATIKRLATFWSTLDNKRPRLA